VSATGAKGMAFGMGGGMGGARPMRGMMMERAAPAGAMQGMAPGAMPMAAAPMAGDFAANGMEMKKRASDKPMADRSAGGAGGPALVQPTIRKEFADTALGSGPWKRPATARLRCRSICPRT